MNNYSRLLKEAPAAKVRAMFFALTMVLYILSFALVPNDGYRGGGLGHLLSIFGIFTLIKSFSYKSKENELGIHRVIRENAPTSPEKTFLFLALLTTIMSLAIVLFIFRDMIRSKYYSKTNYVISLLATIFMSFTSSLWERWSILRKERKNTNSLEIVKSK